MLQLKPNMAAVQTTGLTSSVTVRPGVACSWRDLFDSSRWRSWLLEKQQSDQRLPGNVVSRYGKPSYFTEAIPDSHSKNAPPSRWCSSPDSAEELVCTRNLCCSQINNCVLHMLPLALMNLWQRPQQTTKLSPCEILVRRPMRLPRTDVPTHESLLAGDNPCIFSRFIDY